MFTPIDPIVTAIQSMEQAEFDEKQAKYMTQLPVTINQMNTAGAQTEASKTLAVASAAAATASEAHAATSETNAAASAASAANAPGTAATSTTSLTVNPGGKTLTLAQTGKAFALGQQIRIASAAAPENWMDGTLTAFNPATGVMTVSVTNIQGAGTYASWVVSLSGSPGQSGHVQSGYNRFEFFGSSFTFTAKVTGWHRFTLQGAHGSGAAAVGNSVAVAAMAASGGATGGKAVAEVYCVAGTTYTGVLSAGGASAVIAAGSGLTAVNGNAGGTSTLSGTGLSLACTSGGGGKGATTITPGASAVAAPAAPGTATGGDLNSAGAPSGTACAICSTGPWPNGAATGGAAIPYRGAGYASGDATVSVSSGGGLAATGGAGAGGKSGDATVSAASTAGAGAASAGGGARGASANAASSGATNEDTSVGAGLNAALSEPWLNLTSQGGFNGVGGRGAGSAGRVTSNAVFAGGFGGGSGGSATGTSGSAADAGASGGVVTVGNGPVASGAGGNAWAMIEYYA
nr:hypothetical protein [uncultured Duganella sp.]